MKKNTVDIVDRFLLALKKNKKVPDQHPNNPTKCQGVLVPTTTSCIIRLQ